MENIAIGQTHSHLWSGSFGTSSTAATHIGQLTTNGVAIRFFARGRFVGNVLAINIVQHAVVVRQAIDARFATCCNKHSTNARLGQIIFVDTERHERNFNLVESVVFCIVCFANKSFVRFCVQQIDPNRAIAVDIGSIGRRIQVPKIFAATKGLAHFVGDSFVGKFLAISRIVTGVASSIGGYKHGWCALPCFAAHHHYAVDGRFVHHINLAPNHSAIAQATRHCSCRIDAQCNNQWHIGYATAIAQRTVAFAHRAKHIGYIHHLPCKIEIAIVPCSKKRVAVEHAILVHTFEGGAHVVSRALGDNQVVVPVARVAIDGDGGFVSKLIVGICAVHAAVLNHANSKKCLAQGATQAEKSKFFHNLEI